MRADKTLSELWDLVDSGEHGDTAMRAINTIKKLQDDNEVYELALKVCREAIQKNLGNARYKDEVALLMAFEAIEKSLKS